MIFQEPSGNICAESSFKDLQTKMKQGIQNSKLWANVFDQFQLSRNYHRKAQVCGNGAFINLVERFLPYLAHSSKFFSC